MKNQNTKPEWKSINRCRFAPPWNEFIVSPVTGLIKLCNYVQKAAVSTSFHLVEIGSHAGESASIFSSFDFIKRISCVDPWDWDGPLDLFCYRNKKEIESGRISLHQTTSELASKNIREIAPNGIDLVYIDGDHSYEEVKKDIKNWKQHINKNGFISGHDYLDCWEGVKKAVDEEAKLSNKKVVRFEDGSWILV